MNTILLSIHPGHWEKIALGEKIYEYRKVIFCHIPDKVIFYATSPIQMVVGEALVGDYLIGECRDIWKKTGLFSGLDFETYIKYCRLSRQVIAIGLKDVKIYPEPKPLSDYGVKRAPQSFVYLKGE